jgi:putative peptide zinc metalloprotease protein
MATFLKPYKLEIISNMLALLALGSMVGWPLYRLFSNIHKRGRLPDMKPVRVTISAMVVAGLLFAFFFLPLPVTRVRQSGLVQVQPNAIEKVPVVVPGRLMRLAVQEGQFVRKGAVLAEFSSQQLEDKLLKARGQLQYNAALVKEYDELLSKTTQQQEREQLNKKKTDAEIERTRAKGEVDTLMETRKKLVLTAPRAGYVMGLPKVDELYKTWEAKDLETPFCSIGDPTKLRVLVPISPADYELVKTDLRRREKNHQDLEVTIRVRGMDARTWTGKVVHLPEAADRYVPQQLTTRGGGPLAIKPGMQPNAAGQLEPQAQIYLVGISFTHPDPSICPGTIAQVKIHCEYRSMAWWVWRSLSQTFDLGLM